MDAEKKSYMQKLSDKILEWDKKIDEMKKLSTDAASGAKEEFARVSEELRAKKKLTEEKLAELSRAGDEGWKELTGGIDLALDDLSKALDRAVAKFKKP
ncbi:MAG TPA: hypothetical protein VF857_11125 [Spirochaetota bacterium]